MLGKVGDAGVYWGLLGFTGVYWGLLGFTGVSFQNSSPKTGEVAEGRRGLLGRVIGEVGKCGLI